MSKELESKIAELQGNPEALAAFVADALMTATKLETAKVELQKLDETVRKAEETKTEKSGKEKTIKVDKSEYALTLPRFMVPGHSHPLGMKDLEENSIEVKYHVKKDGKSVMTTATLREYCIQKGVLVKKTK
jgi:hypothetical protein